MESKGQAQWGAGQAREGWKSSRKKKSELTLDEEVKNKNPWTSLSHGFRPSIPPLPHRIN